MCAASLTFSRLTHFFCHFKLMSAGLLVFCLSAALAGSAYFLKSYWVLLAARMLSGVGEGSFVTIAPPFIQDDAGANSKGKWMSLFYAAIPVGTAIGFTYGATVVWPVAFFVEAAVIFPTAIFCYYVPQFLEESTSSVANSGSLLTEAICVESTPGMMKEICFILSSPEFKSALIGNAVYSASLVGFATYGSSFLALLGVFCTEKVASINFGLLVSLAGLIGTPLGGIMLDFISTKQPNMIVSCFYQLSICGFFGAIVIFIAAWFSTASKFFFIAALCFGLTILFSLQGPMNLVIMYCVPQSYRPLAISLNSTGLHLFGDVPSPIIVGWMKDSWAPACVITKATPPGQVICQ
eukprot:GHVL01033379.1.p1 GENE.GHVL01033379.1~~GHVL01033379.1.p1  ORF type:complete len:352 (-),score=29.66 GHVL01033379.1:703-1758(-)